MRRIAARRGAVLAALSLTIGCGAEPAGSRALQGVQGITDLVSATQSGLRDPQRSVIADEAAWTSLWSAIHAGTTPEPARPAVSFTDRVVIVAAFGEQPSGGFQIHIDSVRSGTGGRDVFLTTTRPGPTCMTTQALTQPVHAVSAPVASGSTRFLEAEKTEECSG